MPSLYLITNGALAASADINQIVNTLAGNQNTPLNVRNTDPIAYTLQLENTDAAGKALLIYGPDGTTVLARVQANGVVASPDGTAAAPIVTTTHAQTLTNKALTAPAVSNPVVSGAGATAAGTLGFSGSTLQVGDGTVNAGINVGAWTTFVPTLSQGVVVTATVNVAHYLKIGRRAEIFIQLTATSAGTAAQNIIVSALPAAILPLTNNTATVTGWGYVNTTSTRIGALVAFTSGQLEILVDNAGIMGVNPAVTLANGSIVTMWGSWETAS